MRAETLTRAYNSKDWQSAFVYRPLLPGVSATGVAAKLHGRIHASPGRRGRCAKAPNQNKEAMRKPASQNE